MWKEMEVGMSDRETQVRKETVVEADRGDVWRALTDPALLSEWLADEVELEPIPGSEATFRYDDGEERSGTVTEVDPEHRLAFTWSREDDPPSEVELTLVPAVSGTRIIVTERALVGAPSAFAGIEWGGRLEALVGVARLVLA
jgi:uncharacterized protein YndB with AHSA1/START domain